MRIEQNRSTITYPAPWVFLGKIEGHYAESEVRRYIEGMEKALDQGRLMVAFHDWERMSGYDSVCRKKMTDWTLARRGKVGRHHVLVVSKLVSMGVATANLLLGGDMITAYSHRLEFELALRSACER